MNIEDLACNLVDACNQGQAIQMVQNYYCESVISIEGRNTAGEARVEGKDAVLAKNQWYYDNHVIHRIAAYGPFLPASGDFFSVYFDIDVTQQWSNDRIRMREIGLYQVKDGEIARETFMFHPAEI